MPPDLLRKIVYEVSMLDLDEPPKNKARKIIFKETCLLSKREKLVIVGQIIGRSNKVNQDDIYECMLSLNDLGMLITVSRLALKLSCSENFCKSFNDETKQLEQGAPLPVVITVYKDKSFSFVFKKPPASYLIKKAAKIQKGSQTPGLDEEPIARLTKKQLEQIAEDKKTDLNANTIEDACRILEGTAKSMGIEVVE